MVEKKERKKDGERRRDRKKELEIAGRRKKERKEERIINTVGKEK